MIDAVGGTAPYFTVVVPARNRAATIGRTLGSLAAQTDTSFEVIVVDDGSTDGTTDAANAFAACAPALTGRVTVLRQPPSGVSAARNLGARHGAGDHLVFLDADDEADPSWLAAFRRLHDRKPGLRLAFGGARWRWPEGPTKVTRPEPQGAAFGRSLVASWQPATFTVERSLFDAVGGYAVPLAFSENTELGLRLADALVRAQAGDDAGDLVERRVDLERATAWHDQPLVTFHMPADAQTNAWSDAARFESALYVASQHRRLLARDPAQLSSWHAIAGVAAARLGRHRDARRLFVSALRAETTPRRRLHQFDRLATACVPSLAARRWPPSRTTTRGADRAGGA